MATSLEAENLNENAATGGPRPAPKPAPKPAPTPAKAENLNTNAATGVKAGKLAATKKFDAYVKSGELYSLPVTAVPGCGFLLGILLKRDGITRASELYDLYKAQKKGFAKSLACKFGNWNLVYVNTVIKAFEDWEALHVIKPEKKEKLKVKEEKKTQPA